MSELELYGAGVVGEVPEFGTETPQVLVGQDSAAAAVLGWLPDAGEAEVLGLHWGSH